MKYFKFSQSEEESRECWENSQFKLTDVVLALTDNGIIEGLKIYELLSKPEILNSMDFFICDFDSIKERLGINGDYVEREGNVYSKNFNPKRNPSVLTLNVQDMQIMAIDVYDTMLSDLQELGQAILHELNKKG